MISQSDKEKILFVVHTEYHMLVTLSILSEKFNDPSRFDVKIIQTKDPFGSNRFQFNKDLSQLRHVHYVVLEYTESVLKRNDRFISLANEILDDTFYYYFSFNRYAFIDFFFIQELSKRGTKIILAPDGAAAYGRITRFTPRWSWQILRRSHQFIWVNNFKRLYWYWPDLAYGDLRNIDELWAQYPEWVSNKGRKKIKKIDILKSKESKNLAFNFFDYRPEIRENIIFYTNQPFRNEEINQFEILFLKKILQHFPGRRLLIKLHPTTFDHQKNRLYELDNVEVITDTYPAELIIANLSNSIVLSFWSTSSLLDNPSCRFYWLYPFLKKESISMMRLNLVNPTNHIKLVDDVNLIV